MPVTEPSGAINKQRPSVPSVRLSRSFTPGIEATQIPNSKLLTANKNPTAKAGRFFTNEIKFWNMIVKMHRKVNKGKYYF